MNTEQSTSPSGAEIKITFQNVPSTSTRNADLRNNATTTLFQNTSRISNTPEGLETARPTTLPCQPLTLSQHNRIAVAEWNVTHLKKRLDQLQRTDADRPAPLVCGRRTTYRGLISAVIASYLMLFALTYVHIAHIKK